MNTSLTTKVRFHARNVHIDRPPAGDASKACQAGRFSGGGGRIARGQTPVAHHEAFAATCSESDVMGSADSGILYAFRVTRTLEQDGRDTEGLHSSAVSPSPGEAQVLPALRRVDRRVRLRTPHRRAARSCVWRITDSGKISNSPHTASWNASSLGTRGNYSPRSAGALSAISARKISQGSRRAAATVRPTPSPRPSRPPSADRPPA